MIYLKIVINKTRNPTYKLIKKNSIGINAEY